MISINIKAVEILGKSSFLLSKKSITNMSRFAFLVLCVQVCLIQTVLCGLPCGCNQISYAPSGCVGLGGVGKVIEKYSVSAPSCSINAYEYSVPSVSYSKPISVSAPSISVGASTISSGYGASYGGSGTGVVSAEGIVGASGESAVVGSVPVLGSVAFSGKVPARGSVSIQGQCGCGCKYKNWFKFWVDHSVKEVHKSRTMSRFSILILCVMACLIQMALSQNCGCNQLSYNAGSYGGTGTGQVGVSGNIDACGNTCIVGSVPVLGSVDFGGKVAASGSVSISGQCGCGCN
ncbi:uncharacterized protein LOC133531855 [Cydia pomonella]|uniref:uncharacterized protein LOC133531855 n=1 Tax=Cydia pomonella TaxID=82600 RepID=UPI002ADDD259|nr:uncharacterized protein LOC133531855 [Cydia pomonella]